MEDFGRRATDRGKEDPMIILTRIDERLRNLDTNFADHKNVFNGHLDDDKKSFAFLNKTVYIGMGIFAVIQFILIKMIK